MCATNPSGNDLGLTDVNNSNCNCEPHDHGSHEHAGGHSTTAHVEHYLINGMTCSHCVTSVTEELSALPGVESVKVRLNAGGTSQVMVESSDELDLDAVRSAVDEAGYELAGTAQ